MNDGAEPAKPATEVDPQPPVDDAAGSTQSGARSVDMPTAGPFSSLPAIAGPAFAAAPATLGPYQLLEQLGHGGMGTVYKARHTKLDKLVAIKLLPPQLTRDPAAVARFEREMKAVGKLEHPNIVRAMDANEQDGIHYLVMEYVQGQDLHKQLKEQGPFAVVEACRIIRQAAIALAHAHQNGLIHRDIKPSNLLITPDGQLKVLDLGLARLAQDDDPSADQLTNSGVSLGTPDYMAPEQWSDTHTVDHRTDLYALGCTLGYLLLGHPPFGTNDCRSVVAKMQAHVMGAIPSLRTTRSEVPAELDKIFGRLLAKEAKDRFASAADLAKALDPFCQVKLAASASEGNPESLNETANWGAPQGAIPVPSLKTRRRLWPAVAGGVMVLVLAAICYGTFRGRSDKSAEIATNTPVASKRTPLAETILTDIPPKKPDDEAKLSEPDAPISTITIPKLVSAKGWLEVIPLTNPKLCVIHVGDVTGKNAWTAAADFLRYMSDGKYGKILLPVEIASDDFELELKFTCEGGDTGFQIEMPSRHGSVPIKIGSGLSERGFVLTPSLTNEELMTCRIHCKFTEDLVHVIGYLDEQPILDQAEPLANVSYKFEESRVDAGHADIVTAANTSVVFHEIRLKVNAGELRLDRTLPAETPLPKFVSIAPLRGLVPTPAKHPGLGRWQIYSREPLNCIGVAWSPDGRWTAMSGADGQVRLYSTTDGKLKKLLVGQDIGGVVWHPSSQWFATARETVASIWSIEGKCESILRGHASGMCALSWSPDGKLLASGSFWREAMVRLWNTDGTPVWSQSNGTPAVSFAWTHDNRILFIGTSDGGIQSRVVATGKPHTFAIPHGKAIAISPDGERLAVGRRDSDPAHDYAEIWDVATVTKVQSLQFPDLAHYANSLAYSPDGKFLAMATQDAHVRIWDVASKRVANDLSTKSISAGLGWDFESKQLTFWTEGKGFSIWRPFDGTPSKRMGNIKPTLRRISPDGRCLATRSEAGEMPLFTFKGARTIYGRSASDWAAEAIIWSPDGSMLIGWDRQHAGCVVDTQTGIAKPLFSGHTDRVVSAAWSHDQKRLATSSADSTIRIWTRDGVCERTIEDQPAKWVLAWSPDGAWLAGGRRVDENSTKGIRLWNTATGKPGPLLNGPDIEVGELLWLNDQRLLATMDDGTAQLWELKDAEGSCTKTEKALRVVPIPGDPEHPWLVIAQDPHHHQLRRFESTTTIDLQTIPTDVSKGGTDSMVSVDGTQISLWCDDGALYSWSTKTGELLRVFVLLPHDQAVTFSPNGEILSQTPNAQKELVYAVEQPSGALELFTPADFRKHVSAEK